MKKDGIKVEGHRGTWYVIDEMVDDKYGRIYLLEHETYGDMAASVIVDGNGKLLLEDVWNGFEDWEEFGNTVKVRITWFDELFPENSLESEFTMTEEEFDILVEDKYYDEVMDMYYTEDNTVGYTIIG